VEHTGEKITGIKIVLTARRIKQQRLTLSYERKKWGQMYAGIILGFDTGG